MPVSSKVPGSSSASTRSRAVSLPCACCRSSRASPPPFSISARCSRSWAVRSSIERVWCLFLPGFLLTPSSHPLDRDRVLPAAEVDRVVDGTLDRAAAGGLRELLGRDLDG